jgi:hypothetical protein
MVDGRRLVACAMLALVGCRGRPLAIGGAASPDGSARDLGTASARDGGSGAPADGGTPREAGGAAERSSPLDAVASADLARPPEAATVVDVARPADAAPGSDVAQAADAAPGADAALPPDAGTHADTGPGLRGCFPNGSAPPQAAPLFGPPVHLDLPGNRQASAIAVGDVNGDGRADIVVRAVTDDLVIVVPQTPAGDLGAPALYASGMTASGRGMMDIGDVNGDGRLDVVLTNGDLVGVMKQDASGGLGTADWLTPSTVGFLQDVVAVGDFDGDGRSDVLGAGWDSRGVDIWFQAAGGVLLPPRNFICPHDTQAQVAIGDVDGDGLTDIAITNKTASVLLQRPGGFTLVPVGEPALDPAAQGIGVVDVRGDCSPDIVFVTEGGSVGIAEQVPTNAFAKASLLASSGMALGMAVADVDADGRADVVVLHPAPTGLVGVFRQLPTGGLAPEEPYLMDDISFGTDRLAVADINGDGRPDVIAVDAGLTILYHL